MLSFFRAGFDQLTAQMRKSGVLHDSNSHRSREDAALKIADDFRWRSVPMCAVCRRTMTSSARCWMARLSGRAELRHSG